MNMHAANIVQLDEAIFEDDLTPGTNLMHGQYEIESFLASGGFGITYTAYDSLDRRVVIKECYPQNFCRRQNTSVLPRSRNYSGDLESIVQLFAREAFNLSKVRHPNIVRVHQVFEENNTAYMVLDYVEGVDLLDTLENNPASLTPEKLTAYLLKILSAVEHVHEQGMLHRDISPDNIVISKTGEPILIDFGAARDQAREKTSRLLSSLHVIKDGYSPQEFYIEGSEQGPSSDLYSLAASFYHLITGALPPHSQTRLAAFATKQQDPYVPLANRIDGYSENFLAAVDKALSIMPAERIQSAAEWIDIIQQDSSATSGEKESAQAPEDEVVIKVGTHKKLPVLVELEVEKVDTSATSLDFEVKETPVIVALVARTVAAVLDAIDAFRSRGKEV
ncbi:serine/threonine protein kinase [Roseovarius aestuarii]|uniref:Serine/threonine-protein kinase PrkC n=1 Tax=Roseovarius aestuarii TaxID=475083 RepID=A0A1X7BQW1_9RHOB|nr:serine/threonine-protein kinase [Roseovarius aestuarii]SMC11964.1 Serine/threonine-protein kinase PrkC [Roseovarius aestuarii]